MDIKEVKIAHLKAIMKNEGLSGNKFAKKLKTKTGEPLKPSNLSNYLTGKKEVFDTLASQIMDAFPDSHYRRAYILGLDEYMTESDAAKASWSKIFNGLDSIRQESFVKEHALFSLASIAGFEIKPIEPIVTEEKPIEPEATEEIKGQTQNFVRFLRQYHSAGVTITRDGKKVSLCLKELDLLENKLRDYLEFELLHMIE